MLTRRRFTQLGAMASASLALNSTTLAAQPTHPPDITLDIAPFLFEASPKHRIQTIAYNSQVPGPLLRMKQGRPVTVDIHNRTADPEVVHWHGLYLPSEVDGAMEEGTPMIAPGGSTRIAFTPDPAGFRWFHTHTSAGKDLRKGQYSGLHGFLMIEPNSPAAQPQRYDREFFLALHDWEGREMASDDGSMMPQYEFSTVNGKMLGFGEPLQVKQGERVMLHILNSSPTEVHWVALAGHTFRVIALDGNAVPLPRTVSMLRLGPAERVSAIVDMSNPGIWVLGEVRKHIQAAGMGIVIEYAHSSGKAKWLQPPDLVWDYLQFAESTPSSQHDENVISIPLAFASKFRGHGTPEQWMINGRPYPENGPVSLRRGQRYRLELNNHSTDDHPIHLHRHTFQLRSIGATATSGLLKDVIVVPAKEQVHVDFTANNPGDTLFHCHQQDHMDNGFMMLFRYA
jgi:FtsP/CotA-like multicopper oxidase with cupredoxin domain